MRNGPAVLELGSNIATIVAEDADLALAAERCAVGAMSTGGQSCISVQRVFAQRSVAPALAEAIADRVSRLRTGAPYSPEPRDLPVRRSRRRRRAPHPRCGRCPSRRSAPSDCPGDDLLPACRRPSPV
jgi:acyl-CoA reductase-like NAD-dependent aldehyde dehydrogenase